MPAGVRTGIAMYSAEWRRIPAVLQRTRLGTPAGHRDEAAPGEADGERRTRIIHDLPLDDGEAMLLFNMIALLQDTAAAASGKGLGLIGAGLAAGLGVLGAGLGI